MLDLQAVADRISTQTLTAQLAVSADAAQQVRTLPSMVVVPGRDKVVTQPLSQGAGARQGAGAARAHRRRGAAEASAGAAGQGRPRGRREDARPRRRPARRHHLHAGSPREAHLRERGPRRDDPREAVDFPPPLPSSPELN